MAKFAYNKAKNANTGYMPFELNYGYHPQMLNKKKDDFRSKFESADKLLAKLKKLMIIY